MNDSGDNVTYVITTAQTDIDSEGGGVSTWIFMGIALILAMLIIVVNSVTIIVIKKTESLQTLSNMYITSLAFVDLLVGISLIPFASFFVPYVQNHYFVRYHLLCVFMNSFSMSMTLMSVLHLMLISIDRCSCIVAPFHYSTHVNRKRTLIVIICAWIACVFYLILPLVIEDRDTIPKCDTTAAMPKWYVVYCNTTIYFTASIVTMVMYAIILQVATKHRKRINSLKVSISVNIARRETSDIVNSGHRKSTGVADKESVNQPTIRPPVAYSVESASYAYNGSTVGDIEQYKEIDTTTQDHDINGDNGQPVVVHRITSKRLRLRSIEATLKNAKFFATVFGVFFLNITPAVISMSLDYYDPLPRSFYNACSLIALTNSAANFFIFCSRDEIFRKHVCKTITVCEKREATRKRSSTLA